MAAGTLRTLFEHELNDLRAAEQQILAALPNMISSSTSNDLKRALQHHLDRTRIHAERLDLIFKQCGITGAPGVTSGVEGTIRGGRALVEQQADPDVRDAAIIDAAQHVEHYEIAGYGCARTFARQLGDDHSADLLQQTLDEEGDANKRLTDIAESGINQAASQGADVDRRRPGRLRYVALDDLPAADEYRDTKVRNRAGDDLGRVDGFVLDEAGRPYYMVVDSGGLFIGRRYIVPIGRADFRRADRVFTIDLDKDTMKRYPEFHAEAFIAMSDDEARRYEWRVLEAVDPAAARASTREWSYDRYPQFRQPDWFDIAAPSAGAGRAAPIERERARVRREVPISDEQETRERIVARENPADEEPPRERVRGSKDDLT